MIFPHTVIVHLATWSTDPDGNPVRVPTSSEFPVAAYVQPAPGTTNREDPAEAQNATAEFVAYLDGDCPELDAYAAIQWDGRTFELRGEPQKFTDPDGAVTYYRARIWRR